MKLLLTSAGIRNEEIANALFDLVGKPFNESVLAFIPTAANVEEDDKSWLIDDYYRTKELGFKTLDIVDFTALPEKSWKERLADVDVLMFGGGNTFYLMDCLVQYCLDKKLREYLTTKVYVGVSAGSCVACPKVQTPMQKIFADEENKSGIVEGLNLVDFYILPHLYSPYFEDRTPAEVEGLANEMEGKIYALDDESAVKVKNDEIKVVSTSDKWRVFNEDD